MRLTLPVTLTLPYNLNTRRSLTMWYNMLVYLCVVDIDKGLKLNQLHIMHSKCYDVILQIVLKKYIKLQLYYFFSISY